MLSRLPPVGHAVTLQRDVSKNVPFPQGYTAVYVQSGTAALALALKAAAITAGVEKPEVLIPAYSCPDLVSAAVYAGVRPVLVDLEKDCTYMSLAALQRLITPSTVAVIAVNFLGLPERVKEIAALLAGKPVALIEDNAQWFPPPDSELVGDYCVLSFGRGKPVSLLGGGALLYKQDAAFPLTVLPVSPAGIIARLNTVARYLAYNTLRKPLLYGMLERLPMLKLGETNYKPLHDIGALDDFRLSYLPGNASKHVNRDLRVQQTIREMIKRITTAGFIDLPTLQNTTAPRLLRYPLLVKSQSQRDNYLQALQQAGTGASALYASTLPNIPGVAELVQCPETIENAESFACRLVTLPVHELVTDQYLDIMRRCLA